MLWVSQETELDTARSHVPVVRPVGADEALSLELVQARRGSGHRHVVRKRGGHVRWYQLTPLFRVR